MQCSAHARHTPRWRRGRASVPVGTFDGPCSACCGPNWSACTHKMSTLVHVCVSHWSNLFPTSGRLSDQIRPGHSVCVGHLGWVHVVATGRVYSICGQSRLSLASFFVRSCACARHASALLCVCKTRELGSLAAEGQLEEREELKEAMAHRRATHSGIKEAVAHRRATHSGIKEAMAHRRATHCGTIYFLSRRHRSLTSTYTRGSLVDRVGKDQFGRRGRPRLQLKAVFAHSCVPRSVMFAVRGTRCHRRT